MEKQDAPEVVEQVAFIPVARIRRYLKQPREYFDKDRIAEIARSMKILGQKDPIVVKKIDEDPDHDYELINGEERWRAAPIAGIKKLKAIIRNITDEKQQFIEAVTLNHGQAPHTDLENARII